jgi:uncharacterized membrane protein YfcA
MTILLFILLGFIAQMVDGALGMAYGVTSNSLLLSFGVSPAVASASVHIAEVFTTFVSGISHFKLGNINKYFVKALIIPGVIGGVVGAYLLTSIDGNVIKPFITVYLLLMGLRILVKAIRFNQQKDKAAPAVPKVWQLGLLGLVGGFFDAVGGGGWGPIVTTTLISGGHSPRESIGSVNASEFFVTLAEAATFIVLIGITEWQVIVGLIIGGVIAAPLGALVTRKMPTRVLMFIVAGLIIFLQVRTLLLMYVL